MNRLFPMLFLMLLAYPDVSFAQYAIADIPEALVEDANLVIRESVTEWKITSKEEATIYKKEVISLMNDDAYRYAFIEIPYDSFRKISKIKIKIYDEFGNAVKVKAKNLQDVSTSLGSFQIDDSRAKILDLSDIEYPFSYELEYETKMKGILSFPYWVPQHAKNMSLEKASMTIRSKKGYKYKYKENNLNGNEISESEGFKVQKWSINNLSAIKRESFQEDFINIIPLLKLAPEEFIFEGYEGSMKTWNDFGIWYNQLLNDTKKFPVSMQEEIKEMVKDQPTDLDKIKAIYKHLQDNTRYVSIQLGIGGLKPFDPDFVHEKNYGDCKALSFYTQAMLASVGIPSNLVLVRAGRNQIEVDADFPSDQFNHIFLFVPQEQDTIWLECTSQTVPFGYLGDFTSDRNVLVIKENGGELIRTPKYEKEDNTIVSKVKINLDHEGAAKGEISNKFNGLEYDNTSFSALLDRPQKDQEDWIKSYYDISEFTLSDYHLLTEESDCLGELKSTIESRKLASTVGKRMFFKPIVVDKFSDKKIKKPEERKTDFEINTAYRHKGTFEYNLPETFQIEKNIKELEVSNKFGAYSLKIKSAEDGKVVLERSFEINDGKFPASEYVDFVAFLNQIKKADNQKVALVMTKEP